MTDRTKKPDFFLTETIIAIHNDIQSAIDYISEVAAKKGTELGKSSVVMGIERLRIKVPIQIGMESNLKKVEEHPEVLTPTDIKRNLMARKGFLIDRGEPGKLGSFTKVRVMSLSKTAPPVEEKETETADTGEVATGEIEITFVPLKREL